MSSDLKARVEKVVFDHFYPGPLAGSKARLAAGLINAFPLIEAEQQVNELIEAAEAYMKAPHQNAKRLVIALNAVKAVCPGQEEDSDYICGLCKSAVPSYQRDCGAMGCPC